MKHRLVERRGIREALDKIERYPYTVVIAPMGYGKSTAVREYLSSVEKSYVWVTIGTKQTNKEYIWDRITTQIKNQYEEIGETLNNIGFPKDEGQLSKTMDVIRHAINDEFYVVLDDYHLVHSREVDNFIENLIFEKIPNLHLILVSRGEPNTNIHELVLKGQCNIIRQGIFELSKEEIKEYLTINNCNVTESMCEEIYNYTEGWVAPIYLIMMEIIRTGDFGNDYTLDRLVESTLFNQYDNEEQEILLKLSILDSYTAEQALYLTENNRVKILLMELSSYNSFLKYDKTTRVYKPHNILNSFLSNKLKRAPHIDERKLKDRAATWYIENGDEMLGFSYLVSTNNYNKILDKLSKPNGIDIVVKYPEIIQDIFNKIDEDTKLQYPLAYIAYVYWLILIKDNRNVKYILNRIESRYNNYSNNTNCVRDNFQNNEPEKKNMICNEIIGEVYLAKAAISKSIHDFSKNIHIAKNNLKNQSQVINKKNVLAFVQPIHSITIHRTAGEYKKCVEQLCLDARTYIYLVSREETCAEYLLKAEYYSETMDLKLASIYARKAIYAGKVKNRINITMAASIILLRIKQYENKLEENHRILREIEEKIRESKDTQKYLAIEMGKTYIRSRGNSKEKISYNMEHYSQFQLLEGYHVGSLKYIYQCDILLHKKKFIELGVIANNFIKFTQKESLLIGVIYAYIYKAIAEKSVYGMKEAKEALIEALKISKEDNILLTLVEYASEILEIIYEIKKDKVIDSEYMDKLIYHSEKYIGRQTNKQEVVKSKDIIKVKEVTVRLKTKEIEKISLLTNREKEVLQLIALGKTNKSIGKELFISEYTVKTMLSNIYRKIEVKGRVEAAKLLMEYGMD